MNGHPHRARTWDRLRNSTWRLNNSNHQRKMLRAAIWNRTNNWMNVSMMCNIFSIVNYYQTLHKSIKTTRMNKWKWKKIKYLHVLNLFRKLKRVAFSKVMKILHQETIISWTFTLWMFQTWEEFNSCCAVMMLVRWLIFRSMLQSQPNSVV